MKEEFRDIEGYGGLYQVSNCGNIRSLGRLVCSKSGSSRKITGGIVQVYLNTSGYYSIHLWKNNKSKNLIVHRLEASAFIDNPENKPNVNHKNGIKTDNRLENLEWCTQKENIRHSFKMGFSKKGADHYESKLTESQVLLIKYGCPEISQPKLAKIFEVNKATISLIRRNINWKHV